MKNFKFLPVLFFVAVALLLASWLSVDSDCKNSAYLLSQSQKKYDAKNQWEQAEINLHIQEPRIQNPQRYTVLKLDKSRNYFEMDRIREDGIEKRIIDEKGEGAFAFNGSAEIPEELQQKYGLNLERSKGYRSFYELMYGLPMSLTENLWNKLEPAETTIFEGVPAYKIKMELKKEIISKHWTVLISKKDYKLLAVEFSHPESPEGEQEMIKFEGEVDLNGLKIPRMRHWYIKETQEYLGSDIVVRQLDFD